MVRNYATVEETLAYVTAENKANTNPRYLTAGSKNFRIDRQRKAVIRNGNKRLGAGSTVTTPPKNLKSWLTSTNQRWLMQNYDDEWEVWIDTLDGVDLNSWYRIKNGFNTVETMRWAFNFWKDSETLDLAIAVAGDANLYAWGGGVAVVSSATANTITKQGTNTFGQARFFANANLTVVNPRTGSEFTYTAGVGTLVLTGVAGVNGATTAELVAGDVLIQKVVTSSNEPASSRNNHTIFIAENQILVGSSNDGVVFMTANDDYTDTTFSSPRVAGEGGLFTLGGPSRGMGKIGSQLILFAGDTDVYRVLFKEVAIGATLAEVLDTKKILTGSRQGCFSPDMIVQLGNSIMYLSCEPAWRYIQDPDSLSGLDPKTLSNPIKPDFDAETWTGGHAEWVKNAVYISAPTTGRQYILEFVEDADGKVRRFWQPPQVTSVGAQAEHNNKIYGGSNVVQEVHELFVADTYSDMIAGGTYGEPTDKVSIPARAAYAYNDFGQRMGLKTFDEYAVEGEIRENTIATQRVFFDFGGATGTQVNLIDGSDNTILEETLLNSSLGQSSNGQSPLGGSLNAPDDAAAFAAIFEQVREDFRKIQTVFDVDQVDGYFAIISHGPNVELSKRRNITIKK